MGCHQPAKAKGDYVMTTFAQLLAGGESGAAIKAHRPAESLLIQQITPVDGKSEMPPKGEPLSSDEVALVSRWISEGAKDDTPSNAVERYTPDHPPIYAKPPVISALDFSPDGKLLAVAGFHEVLLHHADGSGLVARLVGLSERIQSIEFSPDGTQLAVAGGLPERMGELQIWDVAKRSLKVSVPAGYDTIYGASWSPDGKLIAFGMPDNSVRAVKAENGEQVLFMGGHNDWVLDTVFARSGAQLISVARDMSAKLTEVATERFIDNITSITPGALRGGIATVTLHPTADHILVGGSDGIPQIYRTKRETARKIGDNANLIRKYPAMEGRIWAAAFRPDGKSFAAGSSLDARGSVHFYRSDYDATLTPELKRAMEQANVRPGSPEYKLIEEFQTRGAEQTGALKLDSAVYALAWSPDSSTVVAAGADGKLRFIDPSTARVTKELVPVEVTAALVDEKRTNADKHPTSPEEKPVATPIASLEVSPSQVRIDGPTRYNQLVVTAVAGDGRRFDVTRSAKFQPAAALVQLTARGKVLPVKDGSTTLRVSYGTTNVDLPVLVSGSSQAFHPDWVRDVNPVISRMGCNMGTCHGAQDGKDGFKLSLRGYDPFYDVRAFTDDLISRRVNYASPDDSLMLLKMTGAVPHEGGQLAIQNSTYYRVVRDWISQGARLNPSSAKVVSIEIFPKNPVIEEIGSRQQIRVEAVFADGSRRDVTTEAFVESGSSEVATHDPHALITTVRRGEAPILARYEGAYAATTLTVMGNRDGFVWKDAVPNNKIDELAAAKWKRLKIQPSELCTDTEFIRRITLDLTGLPPSPASVRAFEADPSPQREKRDRLIDTLIGSPEFVDHWTNKWSDMLQVNSKFLGPEGAKLFRDWIRTEVAANTPYDKFVYRILTATGSNKENPAAAYYKILRTPESIMENTTHLFLATRFNCNKCHDHPFERWTQDQYFETAAYFAQVELKRDTKNAPNQSIGASAVDEAKPLYEIVSDAATGDLKHGRTGLVEAPDFPFDATLAPVSFRTPEKPSRRESLAAWMTSADNPYFALSYANRIWGYLLGTGIIEPLDDIRAGNPPSNPELLQWLTRHFVESGFNVRDLMATICKSRTYQLSIAANRWNEDDETNFSRAKAKRLPAEVLYDSIYAATGATPDIPGAGRGVRASQLPDAQIDLKSGFLANLGRPVRESACECERSADLQMSAVMAFLSGPAISDAIEAKDGGLVRLAATQPDDQKLIEEIYYRVLGRAPRHDEVKTALGNFSAVSRDHQSLQGMLADREKWWVPVEASLEEARLKGVVDASSALDAYVPQWQEKQQKAEAARLSRLDAARKDLAAYTATLPSLMAAWEATVPAESLVTRWQPLIPVTAKSTSPAIGLKVGEDGSVLASALNPSQNLATDYTLEFNAPANGLGSVTGVAIEAMPHASLPGFGPGLHENGNFVVTEVELESETAAAPKQFAKVKLAMVRVDHIQGGFNAQLAIDGNPGNQNAWAIAGKERLPHLARFSLQKPLALPTGTKLRLKISCRYGGGDYPLGHFAVRLTDSAQPLEAGLPSTVAAILEQPAGARGANDPAVLKAHFTRTNPAWLKRTFAVAKEERPLPADPVMIDLKAKLAEARAPIRLDAQLRQLRQDYEQSTLQAKNVRLTAAQDLTWALINNPEFLFNH
jgi:WD40 repeat protein